MVLPFPYLHPGLWLILLHCALVNSLGALRNSPIKQPDRCWRHCSYTYYTLPVRFRRLNYLSEFKSQFFSCDLEQDISAFWTSLSSSLVKWGCIYLTILLKWIEILHVKYLAQCLAQRRPSVKKWLWGHLAQQRKHLPNKRKVVSSIPGIKKKWLWLEIIMFPSSWLTFII